MSFKKNIEEWILSRSNSYNFYKNQYEKYIIHNKNLDPTIEMEFNQIKNDFNRYKIKTDNQMNTMNQLMKTLLLDYELNNPKDTLKYIQELSDELLIFFKNICEKNNICWWLNYGNLLGAVRHGYFVPWDDEVDIGMMRKDYIKFINIIQNEIDNYGLIDILEIKFKNHKLDGENVFYYLQILVKNQAFDLSLSILNIFPYDFIDETDENIIQKRYNEHKTDFVNHLLTENDFQVCTQKYYSDLNLSFNQTKFIVPGPDGISISDNVFILKTENVFPLKKINFGNNIFFAPNNPHYYLKTIYNDYLTLPKIISIPENVDKFRYIKNKEEIFYECNNRLNEVNSNF